MSDTETTATILDIGARKPAWPPLPLWQAHARLALLKQEFPHRRFTLTGVHHG